MTAAHQTESFVSSAAAQARLKELLEEAGQSGAIAALEESLQGLGAATDETTWRVRFARLGRKLPKANLPETSRTGPLTGLEEPRFYQADLIGRMAYLLGVDQILGSRDRHSTSQHSTNQLASAQSSGSPLSSRPLPSGSVALLTTLYRTGSSREQASVMRTLPWLPDGKRFESLASEAARTNDVDVFAALCIENPFPARWMSDDAFFQVVMKSMFLGQDTRRIVGLLGRVTPELKRMAADYRREREAAGRLVPPGVALIEAAP